MERDVRFWDRSARSYARARVGDPAGHERMLARTRDLLDGRHSVLELGCGTGSTALRLAGGVRRYLATDISPAMIAIARERLAADPVPNLAFAVAAAEDVPSETYDAVLGLNYIHLVDDIDGTLRTIHRLLAPGGLLITKTPCLADMNRLVGGLLLPLMRAIGQAPTVTALRSTALQARIAAAGFDILAVETHASRGNDNCPYIVAARRQAP